MGTVQIFLASSEELKDDREAFERLVNRRNKAWRDKGVFLELVVWEDFLDAVSKTRLQDEYDRAVRGCDVFVMLFFTKVGRYTEEEFETAFGQFSKTGRPVVYTYFKDAPVDTGSVDLDGLASVAAFKRKLAALGHFHTTYRNVEGLQLHFIQQLDKLAEAGVIEFDPGEGEARAGAATQRAAVEGDGGVAQGAGAMAAGAGGVVVGGSNSGDINTGTRIGAGRGGRRRG